MKIFVRNENTRNAEISNPKFRFIPFRKRDIFEMCLADNLLRGQEEYFCYFYRLLDCTFHYEFYLTIETLKDAYAANDPDRVTLSVDNSKFESLSSFADLLCGLLDKANYERIEKAELEQALKESALFPIRLTVELNDFEEIQLFFRGSSVKKETIPTWMGFMKKNIVFLNYDRVVVYLRLREEVLNDKEKMATNQSGLIFLKLFQNVPRADLEMVFPNTRVSMRTIDKLMIGIPAVITGGVVITTRLGAALVVLSSLVAFWLGLSSQPVELNPTMIFVVCAGLVAFGAYLWKQLNNFKNRKIRFMKTLIQNLYFRNLDNNLGVIYRIANEAEEEECKEALLAYYLLLINKDPLTKKEIKQKVESWFQDKWNCHVDFEIDDAVGKLLSLDLAQVHGGKVNVLPLKESIQKLDQRWDALFATP